MLAGFKQSLRAAPAPRAAAAAAAPAADGGGGGGGDADAGDGSGGAWMTHRLKFVRHFEGAFISCTTTVTTFHANPADK